MKIATWNVNSIKPRLAHLVRWLDDAKPDVVLLQETKTTDEAFPLLEVNDAGFNVALSGQKTYNGVAILSRRPMDVEAVALPGDASDEQARYIEAVIDGVRVASLYAPNGNPAPGPKYDYKLAWLERLETHARHLLGYEEALVLGGDYNVAPTDDDVHAPEAWADDALCLPASRAALRRLLNLGLYDAFRLRCPEPGRYSWWDYRKGAWNKDQGLRIDHLLLSPQAVDRLSDAGIDRTPRGWEKTSDHTPVWCVLSPPA